MPAILTAIGTDATNSFQDLSGISLSESRLKRIKRRRTKKGVETDSAWVTNSDSSNDAASGSASPVSVVSINDAVGALLEQQKQKQEQQGRQHIDHEPGDISSGISGWDPEEEDDEGDERGGEMVISNPYAVLIEACEHNPKLIQEAYQKHRLARNLMQRDKLLSPDFPGVTVDHMLSALVQISPSREYLVEKEEIDPRHCLVFWARPPEKIKSLVQEVQRRLVGGIRDLDIGDLWLMPPQCLHMTVLEITHSTTVDTISSLVEKLTVPACQRMVSYPKTKRARLVRPMLSFDAAALAISFLPSRKSSRCPQTIEEGDDIDQDSDYTYHHLRRDLYKMCEEKGVAIDSRYVVPSAHITIGRFISRGAAPAAERKDVNGSGITTVDVQDKIRKYVEIIEGINRWLDTEWEKEEVDSGDGKYEWDVDEVVLNRGMLWYGGGEAVARS